ncbi:ATP-dependent DNA helicase RecQ [Pacificibacter maritimus]|uniref:DNA helicase RecQ n=1 Tax=Pacificibacter maritimus TaxID=762213 RepID=A0A3N4UCR4_9RHOB|nr:DNA helicase RecQ [Pacificibacter maritimus]RPE63087.1 ATP-dependent DNA helicase RecQ [Pacificibacter maritimus]
MSHTQALLSSVFGFSGFRPGQEEIVNSVSKGENVLAIMPTGGGKSLCFQLPALVRDGLTVVISPLIALMRDQVEALKAVGVEAGALTSGNTDEETDAVFEALSSGRLKLLYMAPERLSSGGTLTLLRRSNVTMIAVDEAHCVSQWGHDFRPDYLRIGELRRALDVPLCAFTATADEETRDEIVARLFDGEAPQTFLRGFDRPNIHLAFAVKDSPRAQILSFAKARKGQSGIVYCGTRAKTESLAKALNDSGQTALAYHGGMERDQRRDAERRFQQEDELIVVATVAFGMGIDKPDIRWVAHADLPKSVESYYQEIGRAGRDGAPAETLTLFGPDDMRFRRTQIDESPSPVERRAADHARLNALLGIAEAQVCRRQNLLSYFGEASEKCGTCDLCDTPPELFDGTEAVRKALSAILRCDEGFGAGHLIDVLMGKQTDKVKQWSHDTLSVFGIGKEYDKRHWNAIFRQMMGMDLVRPNPDRFGALFMTEPAVPILKGQANVTLRRDTLAKANRGGPVAKALVSDEDAPLLSALKAKRRSLSEEARVPAYVVFADRTLIEMAETRPQTLDDMARIGGVGAKKLEKYGDAFLSVILGSAPEKMHPSRRKLATRGSGDVFERLLEAQANQVRGACGTLKPMTLTSAQLSRIAATRPRDLKTFTGLVGPRHAERFGEIMLRVIHET